MMAGDYVDNPLMLETVSEDQEHIGKRRIPGLWLCLRMNKESSRDAIFRSSY